MVESFYQIVPRPAPEPSLLQQPAGNKPAPLSFSWVFFNPPLSWWQPSGLSPGCQHLFFSGKGGVTWKPDSVFQMSLHECWALTITPLNPLPLVLLMQPGMGLTFIAMRACCWFMSHLLSIRTSASSLALVVLASYSTISAKGWGGFVPDIGPWCLPWLCFIKFLLYFSSL